MIICEKCFCDEEIISIIRNLGEKGNCSNCGSHNTYIYDTDKHNELTLLFEDLIDIYTPSSILPQTYPRSEIKMIKDILISDWNIFNKRITSSKVYHIIKSICREKYNDNVEIFDTPVGLKELYDEKSIKEYSLLETNKWDDFVDALKWKNRFHTHYINLKLLDKICTYIRKTYKKGTKFYRCRIGNENGFTKDEMGAPPSEKASEGRINALGISCLYLGDSEKTTIHEARAGAYYYVTIGEFELLEDIVVVDLKRINKISPFSEFGYIEHSMNLVHLNKINDEMSKALRSGESRLNYVATQYIADYIKTIEHNGKKEYSGIEYKSVMNKKGYNLAIFYPELFKCMKVITYKINSIDYDTSEADPVY